LVGIIIASMVNLFLASSIVQLAVSVVGVIVFVGLTAYDTQRIKEIYLNSDSPAIAGNPWRSAVRNRSSRCIRSGCMGS
jgi:FtsH-binding integral membrane protein